MKKRQPIQVQIYWFRVDADSVHIRTYMLNIELHAVCSGISFERLPSSNTSQFSCAPIFMSLCLCVFVCVCVFIYIYGFMENQYQVEFQLINGSFGHIQPDFSAHFSPPLSLCFCLSFRFVSFSLCHSGNFFGHHI